jgi:hypothetical protein
VVLSQAVCPVFEATLNAVSPMLAPCNVKLKDPVAAPFLRNSKLTPFKPNDKLLVMLPTRPPAVINTARLLVTIWLERHRVEESDSHMLRSQADIPILTFRL